MLGAAHDFWNPAENPDCCNTPVSKRVFRRRRNYMIILGLLASARADEMRH